MYVTVQCVTGADMHAQSRYAGFRRMFRFLKTFSTVLLFSLVASSGWAQLSGALLPGNNKPASSAPGPVDPLGRTTPRSAMYKFLEACHEGKYALAAEYLNLRKLNPKTRESQGSELAQNLKTLLDRNYRFQLSKLSDSPEGNKNDALLPNMDELATFDLNGETVRLNLERVEQQSAGMIWLVSADSVSQIPDRETPAFRIGEY
jgi:hypothetical protein